MALLETPVKHEGFKAPAFTLKNIDGRMVSFDDIRGAKATLVMFICNHCPYVKAVIERLIEDCRILQEAGVGCIAIMPNDTENYPEDSFENMKKFAKQRSFAFPYLIDETQNTARDYGAVCTPDIFGFDASDLLAYRGRVDSAGAKAAGLDMVRELRIAMLEIVKTGKVAGKQFPSMGCSIKWRE